jgi:hypothetical protein
MLGVLDQFWPPVVPCYDTEDAVRVVNSFITIPITRNYNHSQLFLTLCHIYTAYNHTRSWLQSLIILFTRLHWLTSQLSITLSNYHRFYIFTLPVSVSYRDLIGRADKSDNNTQSSIHKNKMFIISLSSWKEKFPSYLDAENVIWRTRRQNQVI